MPNKRVMAPAVLSLLFTPQGAVAQQTAGPAKPDIGAIIEEQKSIAFNKPLCATPDIADFPVMVCGMTSVSFDMVADQTKKLKEKHATNPQSVSGQPSTVTVIFPDSKAWIGDAAKLGEAFAQFHANPKNKNIQLRLYPGDRPEIHFDHASKTILASGAFVNRFSIEKIEHEFSALIEKAKSDELKLRTF